MTEETDGDLTAVEWLIFPGLVIGAAVVGAAAVAFAVTVLVFVWPAFAAEECPPDKPIRRIIAAPSGPSLCRFFGPWRLRCPADMPNGPCVWMRDCPERPHQIQCFTAEEITAAEGRAR